MQWPWDLPLHWLPVVTCSLLPVTFLVTYAISVGLDHVEAGFPYISDTGTYSPESCIFGQLLNIGAVFLGILVYVRCKQVENFNSTHGTPFIGKLNAASFIVGWLAALGISLVGNFQETNVLVVHLIGALAAFGLGTTYAWMHTYISYKSQPFLSTRAESHIRLATCIVSTLGLIGTFLFATIATMRAKKRTATGSKWDPSDPGFTEHVLSTASEWVMSLSMMLYFVTFTREFKHVSFSQPILNLRYSCPTDGDQGLHSEQSVNITSAEPC